MQIPIGKKLRVIRETETRRGTFKNQMEMAKILDVSVGTLKNYENGKTQPPMSFIISLCNSFKVNANIFCDEEIYKMYIKNEHSRDEALVRRGIMYVLTGLGITNELLPSSVLQDLADNKALKHFFLFINPTEDANVRTSMPFVKVIVESMDSVINATKESAQLTNEVGVKIKSIVALKNKIDRIICDAPIDSIVEILRRNNNFTDESTYNHFEVASLTIGVTQLLLCLTEFDNVENFAKRMCKSLQALGETYLQIGDNLSEDRTDMLENFKEIYLKFEERERQMALASKKR